MRSPESGLTMEPFLTYNLHQLTLPYNKLLLAWAVVFLFLNSRSLLIKSLFHVFHYY